MKINAWLAFAFVPAIVAAQQSGYVTVSDGARLFYRTSGRPGVGVDTIIAIHGGPGLDLGTIYNDMAAMFGDRHVVKKMIFFGPVPPRKGDYNVRCGRNFSARLDSDLAGSDAVSQRSQQLHMSKLAFRNDFATELEIPLRPRRIQKERTVPGRRASGPV